MDQKEISPLASLRGARLRGASLRDANLIPPPWAVPDEEMDSGFVE